MAVTLTESAATEVKRLIENEKLAQQYTFREREEMRKLDKSGAVKEAESKKHQMDKFAVDQLMSQERYQRKQLKQKKEEEK